MEISKNFWNNKTVFLTGHTGFKGGWIALWLSNLGAKVHGYSLEPKKNPNLFTEANIDFFLESSTIGDIRNFSNLKKSMTTIQPEIVIHMAAQPLVRESYKNPLFNYETNVIGTVNLFEAIRSISSVKSIVNITTDKCYENKESLVPYSELDRIGGYDPYSCSKACVELITSSYRQSFFNDANIFLASVRAGNVIGGGDWSNDRLIPDFFRAISIGKKISLRSPKAIRPWQHVIEPLAGYLMLAEKLYDNGKFFAEPWNFGPNVSDAKEVQWIVEHLCKNIPGTTWDVTNSPQPHEASLLILDSSKARELIGWSPKWTIKTALDKTIEWNNSWKNNEDMAEICLKQIHSYQNYSTS
jgi:CDP-glucose 4,6-dehydratase